MKFLVNSNKFISSLLFCFVFFIGFSAKAEEQALILSVEGVQGVWMPEKMASKTAKKLEIAEILEEKVKILEEANKKKCESNRLKGLRNFSIGFGIGSVVFVGVFLYLDK